MTATCRLSGAWLLQRGVIALDRRKYVGIRDPSWVGTIRELAPSANPPASRKTRRPLPEKGFRRLLSLIFSRCPLT
jgi:hypothetical protein